MKIWPCGGLKSRRSKGMPSNRCYVTKSFLKILVALNVEQIQYCYVSSIFVMKWLQGNKWWDHFLEVTASPQCKRSVRHSHGLCVFPLRGVIRVHWPSLLLTTICKKGRHTYTLTHNVVSQRHSSGVFFGGLEFSTYVWLLGDTEVITLTISIVWCCVTGVSLCELFLQILWH